MIIIHDIIFRSRKDIAIDTPIFFFDKPKDFIFQSGQFVTIRLPSITKERPQDGVRALSIASAPHQDHLAFSWRRSSSLFKKAMDMLENGDIVEIIGPSGQSIVSESAPVVFLVGGIGITPVRSILLEDVFNDSDRKSYLFYSNDSPQSAPFFDEMNNLCNNNREIIHTMTRVVNGWNGEKGFITEEMLRKYVDNIASVVYYIVGTSNFVHAMECMCEKLHIPKDRIISDNFG